MTAFDESLVRLYRERGLLTADDRPVHLSTACPRASVCWADQAPERHPAAGSPAAALSPPHVGRRYEEARLVVVMENLRNYGGWDLGPDAKVGMRFLAAAARVGLGRGSRVLFRGGGYRGTHVWHRAVLYAATWLACDGIGSHAGQASELTPAALAEALDLVVVVQHVKCSPAGGRSEQGARMWQECGPHVLAHELAVLKCVFRRT